MLKRILFIVVYILCFPILTMGLLVFLLLIPLLPILWIVIGDMDKVINIHICTSGWFLSVPYKIVKLD